MRCTIITAPIMSGGRACMCRGVEIALWFDESQLAGQSVLFYAQMLEHFFAQYVSLNSFVKIVARIKGKEQILKSWPPRVGGKALI
jgi:type VI secretion system protein ImpG